MVLPRRAIVELVVLGSVAGLVAFGLAYATGIYGARPRSQEDDRSDEARGGRGDVQPPRRGERADGEERRREAVTRRRALDRRRRRGAPRLDLARADARDEHRRLHRDLPARDRRRHGRGVARRPGRSTERRSARRAARARERRRSAHAVAPNGPLREWADRVRIGRGRDRRWRNRHRRRGRRRRGSASARDRVVAR